MSGDLHIVKRSRGGWEVRGEGSERAASVHRTQADAVAAARRLALKGGGAEVLVHRADGRLRSADTIGAVRAPRSEGPRTTLRVPLALTESADRLADELDISRNDALLRLATRGAQLYELERHVKARRDERWAAVVPGAVDIDGVDLPSPDAARAAILGSRDAG